MARGRVGRHCLLPQKVQLHVRVCMAFGFHKSYFFLFHLLKNLHGLFKPGLVNTFSRDITLDQEVASFFCEGPHSNCFRFCGAVWSL